jgi:hypothetical protein
MCLHIVMMFLFLKVLTNNQYSYFSFKDLFILFIIIRLLVSCLKKKIVFFSHVMTIIIGWSKRSFTFFQLNSLTMIFPAYIYTWDGTHKVETSIHGYCRNLFVLVMIENFLCGHVQRRWTVASEENVKSTNGCFSRILKSTAFSCFTFSHVSLKSNGGFIRLHM